MAAIDSDLVLKRWKPTDTTRPPGRYAVKCEKARGLYARLYPLEMGEVALAHSVGDKTQKAYDRGDMMDRRRDMMNDWADYLAGKQSSDTNVDPLATAIATLRDTGLSIEEIVARLNGDNVIHLPRDVA